MTVVVTGTGWIGGGVGSVSSALDTILGAAEKEIHISAFSFTSRADLPLAAIATALERGVEVRIVVNHLSEQTPSVRRRLESLAAKYKHMHLYDYVGGGELHAKIVIGDRKTALVGSSNLSFRGLMTNHELGVVIEGTDAEAAAAVIDRLLRSALVRRVNGPAR